MLAKKKNFFDPFAKVYVRKMQKYCKVSAPKVAMCRQMGNL